VFSLSDVVPIEHKFKFEQLSDVSQEIVLDKTIDFPGCEVIIRSVLQRHGNVERILGPELVTDLITEGTAVYRGQSAGEYKLLCSHGPGDENTVTAEIPTKSE